MKKTYINRPMTALFFTLLLGACSDSTPPEAPAAAKQAQQSIQSFPELASTQSESWKYMVNNAIRVADRYAMDKSSMATFLGASDIQLVKQYGGEFEGRHLLKVINRFDGNTSLAMLLPLFDEYASVDNLDDVQPQWRIVSAKFNGRNI